MHLYLLQEYVGSDDSVEDIGIYIFTSVSIMYVCEYFMQCTMNWNRLLFP